MVAELLCWERTQLRAASAWLIQWGHSLSERTQGAVLAKNSLLNTVAVGSAGGAKSAQLSHTWVGTSDRPAVAW